MKYVITQHYTTEHQTMFDLTSPINKKYASDNGFDYVFSNIKRCPERNVWWEKIAWLIEFLSTLEDGTYVVYQDCDAITIGGDLKSALHSGFEYGMVQLRGGLGGETLQNWFNAGVIMLLNTSDVRAFLKRVWDRNDDTDETSINKELKSLNNTIGNSKSICSLNVEWNKWNNNKHLTNDIGIRSWHGMPYSDKLKEIEQYIKTI